MTAQRGRDMLVKIRNNDNVFITVAGLRSNSGSGIFRDAESDALMRTAFFEQRTLNCQFILPDFGRIEGEFLINRLSFAGNFGGEATYEISFSSAGAASFAAI